MFGMLALVFSLLMTQSVPKLTATRGNPPGIMVMRMVTLPPPSPSERQEVRRILADDSDVTVPVPSPVRIPPKIVPKPETRPVPVPQKSGPSRPKVRTPPVPQSKKTVASVPAQAATVQRERLDTSEAGKTAVSDGHPSGEEAFKDDRSDALATLLRAVDRYKKYPRQARRTGAEGTTHLLVTIGKDGRVSHCALQGSSGRSVLDAATERLGERLLGLEVPVHGGRTFKVVVPVHYTLKDS